MQQWKLKLVRKKARQIQHWHHVNQTILLYNEPNTEHTCCLLWKSKKNRNGSFFFFFFLTKVIWCTFGNNTNRRINESKVEANIFPNTEHLLWVTWLCPKSQRLNLTEASKNKMSLPSEVESTMTCLRVHKWRGESRLDYLKAKWLEERHILLWGEGRSQGGHHLI